MLLATFDVEDVVGISLSTKTFFQGVGVEWDGGWNWLCGLGSSQTREICPYNVDTEGVYHYTWPNTVHARQRSYQRLLTWMVFGTFLK